MARDALNFFEPFPRLEPSHENQLTRAVFLAPEEPLSDDRVLTESDRGQILDAVIDYGGELLVVVENKVAEDDDLQARHLNVTGAKIRIAPGQEAVVVLWRDVLEAFVRLRERNLLGGAEAGVLDDFLTYVENVALLLYPADTLSQARAYYNRPTACDGLLELARRWPLAEAEALDAHGALAPAIRAALDQALTVCGEPPLGPLVAT